MSVARVPMDGLYTHVSMGSTKCVQCLIKILRKERECKARKGYVKGIWEKLMGEAVIGSKYNVYGYKTPKE